MPDNHQVRELIAQYKEGVNETIKGASNNSQSKVYGLQYDTQVKTEFNVQEWRKVASQQLTSKDPIDGAMIYRMQQLRYMDAILHIMQHVDPDFGNSGKNPIPLTSRKENLQQDLPSMASGNNLAPNPPKSLEQLFRASLEMATNTLTRNAQKWKQSSDKSNAEGEAPANVERLAFLGSIESFLRFMSKCDTEKLAPPTVVSSLLAQVNDLKKQLSAVYSADELKDILPAATDAAAKAQVEQQAKDQAAKREMILEFPNRLAALTWEAKEILEKAKGELGGEAIRANLSSDELQSKLNALALHQGALSSIQGKITDLANDESFATSKSVRKESCEYSSSKVALIQDQLNVFQDELLAKQHDELEAASSAKAQATAQEAQKAALLAGTLDDIKNLSDRAAELHASNQGDRDPNGKNNVQLVDSISALDNENLKHKGTLADLDAILPDDLLPEDQKDKINGAKTDAKGKINEFIATNILAIETLTKSQNHNNDVRAAISYATKVIAQNTPEEGSNRTQEDFKQIIQTISTTRAGFTDAVKDKAPSDPELLTGIAETQKSFLQVLGYAGESANNPVQQAIENEKYVNALNDIVSQAGVYVTNSAMRASRYPDSSKEERKNLLELTNNTLDFIVRHHQEIDELFVYNIALPDAAEKARAARNALNVCSEKIRRSFQNMEDHKDPAPKKDPENQALDDFQMELNALMDEARDIGDAAERRQPDEDALDRLSDSELNDVLGEHEEALAELGRINDSIDRLAKNDKYKDLEQDRVIHHVEHTKEEVGSCISAVDALKQKVSEKHASKRSHVPNPNADKIKQLLADNPKVVARHNSDIFRAIMLLDTTERDDIINKISGKTGYVKVEIKGENHILMLDKPIGDYKELLQAHKEQLEKYISHPKKNARSNEKALRTFYVYQKLLAEVKSEILNTGTGTHARMNDFESLHDALLKRTSDVKESYYLAQAMGSWDDVLSASSAVKDMIDAAAVDQGFTAATPKGARNIEVLDPGDLSGLFKEEGDPDVTVDESVKQTRVPASGPILLTTTYGVKDTAEQTDGRVRMKMYSEKNAVTNDLILAWWNKANDLVIEYSGEQFVVTAQVVGAGNDQRVDFYMRKYDPTEPGHEHQPTDTPFTTEHAKDKNIAKAIADRLGENVNKNLNAVCLKTQTDLTTEPEAVRDMRKKNPSP